jgi:hypothetical protein
MMLGMRYRIDLRSVPSRHTVPPLLAAFADWLASQEHGSVGWFDALVAEEIPKPWDDRNTARLQRGGFVFLSLPDGSLLALLETGAKGAPPAVVLLGSEGEARTVATSLEELLLRWSKGETEINELDDQEASSGRASMKSWLASRKVKALKAPDFDFQAWLDGAKAGVAQAAAPPATPDRPAPEVFAALPPAFRQLASLQGRRGDDPAVVDFITNTVGAKVPSSARDMELAKEVKSKTGFRLWFDHDLLNDAFPLIPKTKNSFLPYLSEVSFDPKWTEKLPFDLDWKQGEAEVTARLGAPTVVRLFPDDPDNMTTRSWWEREIDPGRTYLRVQAGKKSTSLTLMIRQTMALSSRHGVPPLPAVGLFVGWALSRGLLDESRFPQHRTLIDRIKNRAEKGSALVRAAMPRGLWLDHLVPNEGLRTFARRSFSRSLTPDLIEVFGERTDQHSHRQAVLDDDSWEAVDRAAPILDRRFAEWVG